MRQPIAVGCFRRRPQAEYSPAVVDEAPQLLLLRSERLIPRSLSNHQGCHIRRPGREAGNAFEREPGLLKRCGRFASRIVKVHQPLSPRRGFAPISARNK